MSKIVNFSVKSQAQALAENIARNNSLLNHLQLVPDMRSKWQKTKNRLREKVWAVRRKIAGIDEDEEGY